MLLAVDVGNTSTVMGLYREEELIAHWRVGTNRMRMADQYAVFLKNLLELEALEPPDRAIVSSVVPPVGRELTAALSRYWGIPSRVVTSELVAPLLSVETDNPREVGADRMVNAVAATEYGGDGWIAVDFGTATNFDLIAAPDRLLGVALAPGPMVAAEALSSRAAKLPRVELSAPEWTVGTNTVAALQSGLVFGYTEMVDGMVARMKREAAERFGVGPELTVIATGGFAEVLRGHARSVDVFDPLLTLTGLRLIDARLGGGAE